MMRTAVLVLAGVVVLLATVTRLSAQDLSPEQKKQPAPTQSLWLVENAGYIQFKPSELRKSGAPAANLKFTGRLYPSGLTSDKEGDLWGTFRSDEKLAHGWIFEITPAQIKAIQNRRSVQPKVSIFDNGSAFVAPTGVVLDRSGNVWAVTSMPNISGPPQLVEYTTEQFGANVSPQPAVTIVPANQIALTLIGFDQSGNLWTVATAPDGLHRAIENFTPVQLSQSGSPLPTLSIEGIRGRETFRPGGVDFDRSGNLWLVNLESISSDAASTEILSIAASDLVGSGTIDPSPSIAITPTFAGGGQSHTLDIRFDREGNLWMTFSGELATIDGICELTANQIISSGSPAPAIVLRRNKKGTNFDDPSGMTFVPAAE